LCSELEIPCFELEVPGYELKTPCSKPEAWCSEPEAPGSELGTPSFKLGISSTEVESWEPKLNRRASSLNSFPPFNKGDRHPSSLASPSQSSQLKTLNSKLLTLFLLTAHPNINFLPYPVLGRDPQVLRWRARTRTEATLSYGDGKKSGTFGNYWRSRG
jgi:hypothetical protein